MRIEENTTVQQSLLNSCFDSSKLSTTNNLTSSSSELANICGNDKLCSSPLCEIINIIGKLLDTLCGSNKTEGQKKQGGLSNIIDGITETVKDVVDLFSGGCKIDGILGKAKSAISSIF